MTPHQLYGWSERGATGRQLRQQQQQRAPGDDDPDH